MARTKNTSSKTTPTRHAPVPAKLTPLPPHSFTHRNVSGTTATNAATLPAKFAQKLRSVMSKSPKNHRNAVAAVDRMIGCSR